MHRFSIARTTIIEALSMLALMIALAPHLSAQQDTTVRRITRKDGVEITGRIVLCDTVVVMLATPADGIVTIPRSQIAEMKRVHGTIADNQYYPADPVETSLLTAPTGRTLQRGRARVAVDMIFSPSIAYGFTDWLTGGAGIILTDPFGGYYVFAKLRAIHTRSFDLSGGAIYYGRPPAYGASALVDSAGVVHDIPPDVAVNSLGAYVAATYGGEAASLTAGIGYVIGNKPEALGRIAGTFGGELRILRWMRLLSENWVVERKGIVPSLGFRFIWNDTVPSDCAIDVGLYVIRDASVPVFPWINFVVRM